MKYSISKDKSKINIDAVHNYLCNKSYWAKGRSLNNVKKSIQNSICFGLYGSAGEMLGFARVVSDKVVFAYLMDFFIFDDYQGCGLGTNLVEHVLKDKELQVRLWFLATADAHRLYEKFGFSALDDPNRYMFKRDENYI